MVAIASVPVDVLVFLAVVAACFLVGLPLIARRVSVPRRVLFEEVPASELTPAQADYLGRLDAELAELGYRPEGDRRTLNMPGRALVRTYMSSSDPAIVLMYLMTSGVEGAEHPANFLEVVTRYGDGAMLSTRNAEVSDVLEPLPGHVIQERRGVRSAARLKAAHDRRAAEMLVHGPTFDRPEDFVRVFDEYHERWCRHQLERGLLVARADDPERLRPTVRTGLRGIANFLNPLADNFTWARLLVSLFVGLAVPVAAVLWLGGDGRFLIREAASVTGLEPVTCTTAVLTLLMTVTAAVIGWLFVGKSFIWGFLLGYAVLRLAGPLGAGTVLAVSLWTGAVASWTAGRRERHAALV